MDGLLCTYAHHLSAVRMTLQVGDCWIQRAGTLHDKDAMKFMWNKRRVGMGGMGVIR